ncbi:S-adenosyl-L-methionine-dependent methyltransferase [Gilbertella persicaria]|uniref:S-adenosyl-L-methionine-dependent methyltransferase n=1 Tax=Gilbertella persicaria TaxID=101096 RepID=UPI00221FE603|nr:S-adenosyl-L-methionine-dependent methyltransferase [Gilbertella persicaria]KAI8090226.1 S-adenosyl-L-methionine-dependent methyltransferase [Gilbertella persicaria]
MIDVGFGCGDSCFFLAEQYKSRVKGITNEKSQLDIAQKRIPTSLQEHITLSCGSADDLQDHIPSTDSFDAIVSIDSAYHFDTRWDFLKNAFSLLKSKEGKIGLYDLAIEAELLEKATPLQKKLVEWICLSVHIPIQNLVTVDRYQEQMKTIGYDNIHIQALDKRQVFGGVSKSFQQQYELTLEYGVGISFTNRMFLKVSSFFFGLLSEKPWIVPIIVTAEKSQ